MKSESSNQKFWKNLNFYLEVKTCYVMIEERKNVGFKSNALY